MRLQGLEKFLPVRPGEHEITLSLFLYNLFAVGAFICGRAVRDALFLAHHNREDLAFMYVLSAIAVTGSGILYSPLVLRFRTERLAQACAFLFSSFFLFVFLLRHSPPPWLYPLLYVGVEIIGALSLLQFWTLSNELFHAREAKRLYGFISSGGTLANILVGLATATIASQFGTEALLLLCAALLSGTGMASSWAGRFGRSRLEQRAPQARAPGLPWFRGSREIARSPHLRNVAFVSAATFFTTTLVDFEFKVVSAQHITADNLAGFFGLFTMWVGFLSLLLQWFGTSRVLQKAGVVGALSLLPMALGVGNLFMLILPALWVASLTKGADTLFRYSVNDATTQILYLPISSHLRSLAKSFVDGFVKPLSIASAGVFLLFVQRGGDDGLFVLSTIAVACCLIWLGSVRALKSRYVQSLQESLRRRSLDADATPQAVTDRSTLRVFEEALRHPDAREVLNALELLPQFEKLNLEPSVASLFSHAEPTVRAAALEYFSKKQSAAHAEAVAGLFGDPEPSVQAAALLAYCSQNRDRAIRRVTPFLSSPEPVVRGAAIIGLIRFGGLDGVLVAAESLKKLLEHPFVDMRKQAAKVLGEIGVRNFYQPILALMNDADLSVQRQALWSAGRLQSPEFILPLIYKTQSPKTRREAIYALVEYGATVVPTLEKVLDNPQEVAIIRHSAARILGRIANEASVDILCRQLASPSGGMRTQVSEALARIARKKGSPVLPHVLMKESVFRELRQAYLLLWISENLQLPTGPLSPPFGSPLEASKALLGSTLNDELMKVQKRIFFLLSCCHFQTDFEALHLALTQGGSNDTHRRKATALELLDNLIDDELKDFLLPLMEDLARAEKAAKAEPLLPTLMSRTEALQLLCTDESDWVRACTLYYLAHQTEADASLQLEVGTRDSSALVRETCIQCLSHPQRRLPSPDAKAGTSSGRFHTG